MARRYRKITFTLFLITFAYVISLTVFWLTLDTSVGLSLSQNDTVIKSNAGVYPNQFNQVAQQLKAKEIALSEKEEAVQLDREALEAVAARGQKKILTYLSVIGGVLFILILLNFYFDFRKRASKACD